jgi:SOS regulatory protein LexA
MATEPQERNPYVGPRPFEPQDRYRFFGRDPESSELLSLVIAHRVLLVYAPSGAGKTSQDIEPEEIPNLYVFNTLMSWAEEADPRRLSQMSLAGFLKGREHPTDEEGLPSPRVVIFDQFEELFAFYPERWRDREEFFEQVRDALERDPLLRVVFGIREDYIAQLDPYAPLLPEKLRTRFRLERLREGAALAAVAGPLKDTGRSFAQGIPEQLVEEFLKVRVATAAGETVEVTGEFIEPVQLQVVCQSLWRNLPPDITVITQDYLQAFGDVNQALSEFYERSIKRAAQEAGLREADIRKWFERKLITPGGTRGTVYRGREKTGGIPNAAVDVLENLHLIRGEWRAGAPWYELTHDRFIEPIQESKPKAIDIVMIPLVAKIAAGPPILAEENIEDYLSLDKNYAKDATFALQVQGNSMINAAIQNKDVVLIREQPVANNGDIVAVILTNIEDEVTLKRYYQEDSQIILQPENDAEKPIIILSRRRDVDPVIAEYQRKGVDVHIMAEVKVEIVGKVVGVLRTY